MRAVICALACLVCASQGRQVPAPSTSNQSTDPSERLAMLLLASNPEAGWQSPTLTALASRRQALGQGAALLASFAGAGPALASWNSAQDWAFDDEHRPRVGAGLNDIADEDVPASQLVVGDKVDVNNAGITDYKQFPGMFPSAAGQIASHGPYRTVNDIFEIESATDAHKALFKKYASEMVALKPSRMFVERLNGRQSM